jgi:hypothetical protein
MKKLLVTTAAIEAGAGAAFMGFPSATMDALLGPSPGALPTIAVVRILGGVLVALGTLCWLAGRDTQKPCARRMVVVMTAYNSAATALLVVTGVTTQKAGILLWPAVALHAAMGPWCVSELRRTPYGSSSK